MLVCGLRYHGSGFDVGLGRLQVEGDAVGTAMVFDDRNRSNGAFKGRAMRVALAAALNERSSWLGLLRSSSDYSCSEVNVNAKPRTT